ncbi:hypothetical protein AO268_03540 [Pseudomonas sp. ICMP 8385]|nr:hypothetical protein AO268_03540 [Pseudomonas sp. ICMP 8385]
MILQVNERFLSIFIVVAMATIVAALLILTDLLLQYLGVRSNAWPDGLFIFLSAYVFFFAASPLQHSIKKRLRRAKKGKVSQDC